MYRLQRLLYGHENHENPRIEIGTEISIDDHG